MRPSSQLGPGKLAPSEAGACGERAVPPFPFGYYFALGLTLALVVAIGDACGSSTVTNTCTPGEQSSCACTNGLKGAQTCKMDGTAFAQCICEAETSSSATGNGGASSSSKTSTSAESTAIASSGVTASSTSGAGGTGGKGGAGGNGGTSSSSANAVSSSQSAAQSTASSQSASQASSGPNAVVTNGAVTAGTGGSGSCIGDLSYIGTADFHIAFTLVSKQLFGAAIVSQRDICNVAMMWDVTMNMGKVQVETDDSPNPNYVLLASNGTVNDGNPHDVEIARTNGVLSISIDGKQDTSMSDVTNFGKLPALAIGEDICPANAELMGTIMNLCISSP